jgi:thiamine-phosphate pyrophosphorylase|tara:strand:- start:1074 stop:1622 length:549 start_codon:yes stop_codon:yes gene_type:complete
MHKKLPNMFYFIDTFEKNYIRKLNHNVSIIFRNYHIKYNEKFIVDIKQFCKTQNRKFFLSNNLKLALKLNLDGVYLPSFNKCLNTRMFGVKKNFMIIGSAHNIKEIRIKEQQKVKLIFISPLFAVKKNKQFLNPIKFNLLASKTSKKVIALGGINRLNFKKLKMVNAYGFAGISYFNNNYNL